MVTFLSDTSQDSAPPFVTRTRASSVVTVRMPADVSVTVAASGNCTTASCLPNNPDLWRSRVSVLAPYVTTSFSPATVQVPVVAEKLMTLRPLGSFCRYFFPPPLSLVQLPGVTSTITELEVMMITGRSSSPRAPPGQADDNTADTRSSRPRPTLTNRGDLHMRQ